MNKVEDEILVEDERGHNVYGCSGDIVVDITPDRAGTVVSPDVVFLPLKAMRAAEYRRKTSGMPAIFRQSMHLSFIRAIEGHMQSFLF
jgi:hypothetical protein